MAEKNRLKWNRADLLLAGVVLLVAAVLFFAALYGDDAGDDNTVEVVVDGKICKSFPLGEDREAVIETPYGSNTLVIRDGGAWISASDCSNGDCMRMAHLGGGGGVIVCLPHHLVIRVVSDAPDMDVLVQ